jgi:L-serine dehydratase
MTRTSAPICLRLLELFRIGPGPSSSHTVGPMRAAAMFRRRCLHHSIRPARIETELRGSLSATGRGHGTDRAVLAGLAGHEPETCDADHLLRLTDRLRADPQVAWGDGTLRLLPEDVRFGPTRGLDADALPHPNTLVFTAFDAAGAMLASELWCSVGGGFVRRVGEEGLVNAPPPLEPALPFVDARSLQDLATAHAIGFGDVVLRNERAWSADPDEIARGLDRVWDAFRRCIARGLAQQGELPGGLGVRRRARDLWSRIESGKVDPSYLPIARGQAYAYAINEENAAGGIVVTAPTNGAAGIVPGVLVEAAERLQIDRDRIHRALATAGAVAMIVKTHASISGAEVGCQGEVGTATAMAAAALCELLGGNVDQVEYAAEIGLEHNLGLTCDPMKGLVQAPCIERNAMGVAKAWSAAQLALHSDGTHIVSLDKVIRVMKRTGMDMMREYKETSEGGLAVAIPEC